jgi:hypothetical protein
LTADEALVALKGMACGKTLGLDGLPMEFYKSFWSLVSLRLREPGIVCIAAKGVITLIHKRDDPLEMKNWRHITLLNVDYKIATRSRCIAGHLLKIIGSVVAEGQTCGIPGRFIGNNVSLFCPPILVIGL